MSGMDTTNEWNINKKNQKLFLSSKNFILIHRSWMHMLQLMYMHQSQSVLWMQKTGVLDKNFPAKYWHTWDHMRITVQGLFFKRRG